MFGYREPNATLVGEPWHPKSKYPAIGETRLTLFAISSCSGNAEIPCCIFTVPRVLIFVHTFLGSTRAASPSAIHETSPPLRTSHPETSPQFSSRILRSALRRPCRKRQKHPPAQAGGCFLHIMQTSYAKKLVNVLYRTSPRLYPQQT